MSVDLVTLIREISAKDKKRKLESRGSILFIIIFKFGSKRRRDIVAVWQGLKVKKNILCFVICF